MAFGKDSIIYLLSTILCTLTLAGSGNALRQRNINVGNQTAAAAATGGKFFFSACLVITMLTSIVRLDINTDDLTNAGWALGVGAGGAAVSDSTSLQAPRLWLMRTQVGSLILFLYSLHLQPVDRFSRKIFFLSPLMLALNTLLMFAAAFPVTVFGRNNSATVKGYIGNTQLPDSVIKAASTIPVE